MQAQQDFVHLTPSDGLSQSSVFQIFQDRKGYIWIGTQDGLNRYDGHEFKVFRNVAEDPASLPGNEIRTMFEDRRGRLWVSTSANGFCEVLRAGAGFRRISAGADGRSLNRLMVHAFEEDTEGRLLIGGREGLYRMNAEGLPEPWLLSANEFVTALLRDRSNRLWVGTAEGRLYCLAPGDPKLRHMTVRWVRPEPSYQRINFLLERADGSIIAGTDGQGAFRWADPEPVFESCVYFPGAMEAQNLMIQAAQAPSGETWIATDAGLLVLPPKGLGPVRQIAAQPDQPGGLKTHATKALCFDSFGNLWVGLWDAGIHVRYAHKSPFGYYGLDEGLPAERVAGVTVSGGDLWAGTCKGLVQIGADHQMQTHFPGADITSVCSWGDTVLFSIWREGIFVYETQTGRRRKYFPQRLSGSSQEFRISSLAFSGDRSIWLGAQSGAVWKLNDRSGSLTEIPQANSGSHVTALCEDARGDLWIGTYNAGIWRFSPDDPRMLQMPFDFGRGRASIDARVNVLYEDRQRRIWAGANGYGLLLYDAEEQVFISYSACKGLPDLTVNSIEQDRRGRLWLASNEGIYMLNPETGVFRNYREEDGLRGKAFMMHASHQDPAGRIVFGGIHGINVFHPDSVRQDSLPPMIQLSGLRLLNRPLPLTSGTYTTPDGLPSLSVSYRQAASVTFEFVALYFRQNNRCRYAFCLEGFDTDWIEVGSQRNATYTNLNPGRYRFRAKAASQDGVWSSGAPLLELTILPPWYRTVWAYLLYAALLLLMLATYGLYVRYRAYMKAQLALKDLEAANARHLDEVKTNFFASISHELRTPLTLILDPVEQMLEDQQIPPARRESLHKVIHHNALRLLRLINQLLDLSKLEAQSYRLAVVRQDIVHFIRDVAGLFEIQAQKQQISLSVASSHPQAIVHFAPDAIEKILYNLIANALKATDAGGSISVELAFLPDASGELKEMELVVRDSGVGIPSSELPLIFQRYHQHQRTVRQQLGTGIGLSLICELVKLHQGHIRVVSEAGEGAAFHVRLPVGAAAFPDDWHTEADASHDPLLRAAPAEAAPAAKPLHLPLPDHRPLLLIVEDQPEMQHYLSAQLSGEFRVLTAKDGAQGWALAIRHIPDLIISDLIMPEMDGSTLCRLVKTNEKTSHIPVILLTSRTVMASRIDGLHNGADDYLTKPFHFRLLLIRIRNLLEQRRQLRALFSRSGSLFSSEIPLAGTDELFLKKAVKLVEDHMEDPGFGVDQLEKALNMSKMQLYRKLVALAGMPGHAFIQQVRLQRAHQLLAQTALTVAEVAYQVGFRDPSYFTKVFKKSFGKLPHDT
ncbi:MAG: two-component regulator propeller domain-containing protein [Bacteroidia bacterium]|nr:two-component regulator propeller domain-containing protein [Bacteroidia bacterium]